MGSEVTFQQILEEKIAILERKTAVSEGELLPQSDFSEEKTAFESMIASLLGTKVNFNFTPPREYIRRSYPTPPRREKPPKPRPFERTVLLKDLNTQEHQAYIALIELGAIEIKTVELLSESMVKKVFRRLALRLHPDQNPHANPSDFRRAREAYTTLLKRLKN